MKLRFIIIIIICIITVTNIINRIVRKHGLKWKKKKNI